MMSQTTRSPGLKSDHSWDSDTAFSKRGKTSTSSTWIPSPRRNGTLASRSNGMLTPQQKPKGILKRTSWIDEVTTQATPSPASQGPRIQFEFTREQEMKMREGKSYREAYEKLDSDLRREKKLMNSWCSDYVEFVDDNILLPLDVSNLYSLLVELEEKEKGVQYPNMLNGDTEAVFEEDEEYAEMRTKVGGASATTKTRVPSKFEERWGKLLCGERKISP